MKQALRFSFLITVLALLASCSSGLNSLRSHQEVGGTDDYTALEQPIPAAPESDALAQIDDNIKPQKERKWGKKAKGLFAGLAMKKAVKKLMPKDNLASEKGQKASVLQVLLLILLVLLIFWLLREVFGVALLSTLISVAVLVLLILLILYILGEL